jgi:hypothetical protein
MLKTFNSQRLVCIILSQITGRKDRREPIRLTLSRGWRQIRWLQSKLDVQLMAQLRTPLGIRRGGLACCFIPCARRAFTDGRFRSRFGCCRGGKIKMTGGLALQRNQRLGRLKRKGIEVLRKLEGFFRR